MNIDLLANIIGMIGTIAVVASYLLMQLGKMDSHSLAFNSLNLIGAIFLLISLLVHFNLASFIIELFWIAASIIGLVRYYRNKNNTTEEHKKSETS